MAHITNFQPGDPIEAKKFAPLISHVNGADDLTITSATPVVSKIQMEYALLYNNADNHLEENNGLWFIPALSKIMISGFHNPENVTLDKALSGGLVFETVIDAPGNLRTFDDITHGIALERIAKGEIGKIYIPGMFFLLCYTVEERGAFYDDYLIGKSVTTAYQYSNDGKSPFGSIGRYGHYKIIAKSNIIRFPGSLSDYVLTAVVPHETGHRFGSIISGIGGGNQQYDPHSDQSQYLVSCSNGNVYHVYSPLTSDDIPALTRVMFSRNMDSGHWEIFATECY